jgi:hypothetical protein
MEWSYQGCAGALGLITMRSCLLVFLAVFSPSLSQAQEFSSPLDVVGTLYGTYFLNIPVTDISPYFSERLTARLGGTIIGHDQFRQAGFDPLTGQLDWDPRGFDLSIVSQTANTAQVQAKFTDSNAPILVTFDLVKEDRYGWQIDHLVGVSDDQTWCSNAIIALAQP